MLTVKLHSGTKFQIRRPPVVEQVIVVVSAGLYRSQLGIWARYAANRAGRPAVARPLGSLVRRHDQMGIARDAERGKKSLRTRFRVSWPRFPSTPFLSEEKSR